jgi:hypothetical protein
MDPRDYPYSQRGNGPYSQRAGGNRGSHDEPRDESRMRQPQGQDDDHAGRGDSGRYGSRRYPAERHASARGVAAGRHETEQHSSQPGRHDYDHAARSGRSRFDGYGEYETEEGLTRNMGGGPDLFEPTRGGGHYTRAGYGEELRDFGTSYGNASGYADGRRGSGHAESGPAAAAGSPRPYSPARAPDAWQDGPGEGADFGGGGYGGNYRGQDEAFRNQGYGGRQGRGGGQDFGGGSLGGRQPDFGPAWRGEGQGAFGSGFPGEHAGTGTHDRQADALHRGRGPKGYTRSDERLREDICEHLTEDPHIDASDIEISVDQGVVTLTGSIENRWMKYHAEEVVDRCRGVKEINNRLSTPPRDGDRGTTATSPGNRPH